MCFHRLSLKTFNPPKFIYFRFPKQNVFSKEGWGIQRKGVSKIAQPCHREEEETVAAGLPLQKGQRAVRHGRFQSRQLFHCQIE